MVDIKLGNNVDPNLASNTEKQKWIKIPIELIDEYEYSYVFSDGDVERFVESIKEIGLLSPLEVIKKEGRYVVISGHTRLRALKKIYSENIFAKVMFNGIELDRQVPAIVCNQSIDDVDIFERFVEANLQRHPTPSQKEETAKRIIEKYDEIIKANGKPSGRKRKIIGDWVGLSEPTVQKLINEQKEKKAISVNPRVELSKADIVIKKINKINKQLTNLDVPILKGLDSKNYHDALDRLETTISYLKNE